MIPMKAWYGGLILATLFLLDRVTKNEFSLFCNPLGAWGISIPNVWLIMIAFFGLLCFSVFWRKEGSSLARIGWLLVIAGGLGNLFDRVAYGCVVDFIRIGPFPVFNLADVFLSVGVLIVLLQWWQDNAKNRESGIENNGYFTRFYRHCARKRK